VNPGDEVVVVEPYYDSYVACLEMAGGVRPPVPLRREGDGFRLDLDALASAVTDDTAAILFNTPHNPTGAVLDDTELSAIAEAAVRHDAVVVVDEVYEHLLYDGRTHVPISTLPGMADRTLTISSAGKTFSFTGWKVGWATGPAPLVTAVRTAKQFLTYVNAGPLQPAIALGLGLDNGFFASLATDLRAKRDLLCAGLAEVGFDVIVPQGTYFATADVRPLGVDDGLWFCRQLPERCGVVAVPSSVFYADPADGRHLVRFAFCKRAEVIAEAAARLKGL
jgi:N-succinyldiaminopimelate aminotransferase